MKYDKSVDALYHQTVRKKSRPDSGGVRGMNVDFDTEGRLSGLEVLSASKRYSSSDIFNLSSKEFEP